MAGWIPTNAHMSSDEEDIVHEREATIPPSACDWTRDDLGSIGIFYHDTSWSIEELVLHLKCRVALRSFSELPPICSAILQFMKEIWNSTIVTNTDADRIAEDREILRNTMEDFPSKVHAFREKHQELLEDSQNFGIFGDWYGGMQTFFKYLDVFLRRLRQGECCEGTVDLFTKFVATCLLVPENGKACRKGVMNIKGVFVSSTPDVCFPKLLESDETVGLVSMTEMQLPIGNLREIHRGGDFDISDVPSGVLGQHGAGLLIETYRSYFSPTVAGMICDGTKIIFTCLDMDATHVQKITTTKDIGESKSQIYYTKPYDFTNAKDREEILEPLMWLGFVQSIASNSGV